MKIKKLISYIKIPSFFTKKNIQISLIVLCLYLFFLISSIPASIALSFIHFPANIKLSSLSGSVWSGKANQLYFKNIELGEFKWELRPLNLLLGELALDISIAKQKQYFKSEVKLSPSGKIELEETRFFVELSLLQPLTYGMPFAYAGKATGYFPISFIHKNNYMGINGKLSLNSLSLISPQQQSFGDFSVDFRAEKGGATSAKIKDAGGPLNISGQITLTKNGQLNLYSKLAARDSGTSLDQMLSFLGRKDVSGYVQYNYKGKLWR